MELRHLRYFTCLAKEGSFTRAASQLNVTQSTLSHQILHLEAEIRAQLFQRTGRGLTITHAGRRLLECAERVLVDVEGTVCDLRGTPLAIGESVKFGSTSAFSLTMVTALQEFRSSHPGIRVEFHELSAPEIERQLLEEKLDIGVAFVPSASSGLWSDPLFHERLVLLVGKSHPLANRQRLRVAQLHGHELILPAKGLAIRRLIDAAFAEAELIPIVGIETNTYWQMMSFVKMAKLAMIVSERAIPVDDELVRISLRAPALTRTASLLWKRDARSSTAALQLASILKKTSTFAPP